MYNALILLMLMLWGTKASTNEVNIYCGEWPVYCNNNGGLYFDIATAVYKQTIKVNKIVLPYKRAISSMQHDKHGVILGTYNGEIENFAYSRFPVSVDVIAAYMQDRYVEGWKGVDSVTSGKVLLQKFWGLHKELNIPFYTEIDRRDIAYKLLLMGRYKYFISDSVGFELPPNGLQMKLVKNIYTYPAFSHGPEGLNLKKTWNIRIVELYKNGELFNIYSKYPKNISQWGLLQAEFEKKKDSPISLWCSNQHVSVLMCD
ncbi:hypothetical protein RRM51_004235 [Aeromonas veronii]|nr:hypothetical protein [Aeromonas veronii]